VALVFLLQCNAMRVKTFLIRYKQTQFVRDRITQLRLKKGVSEYQMSYDLGHSRSYVYNISSGKSLPPMAEFLQICNYFDITPSQFFDESEENPALLQTAIEELRKLNDDDLMLIIGNIRRLTRE
jgi:transcriptional regulator with XRE-family HTH domain